MGIFKPVRRYSTMNVYVDEYVPKFRHKKVQGFTRVTFKGSVELKKKSDLTWSINKLVIIFSSSSLFEKDWKNKEMKKGKAVSKKN